MASNHHQAPDVNAAVTRAESNFVEREAPIWGAAAIGLEIGRSPRQAYHLLETGAIKSAVKKGRAWAALPSQLRREFGSL